MSSESAYDGGQRVSVREPGRLDAAVDGFTRIVDTLSTAAAYAAAGSLVILALLMLAQISVAAVSKVVPTIRGDIPIVWEYGSYLMGATFMLGSAMTLRAGRHIRLGLVTDNVTPTVRRVLDIVVSALALALVGFLAYSLGQASIQSAMSGTTSIASRTPLWIPLSVFTAGSLLLSLQLVARILAGLTGRPLEDRSLGVATSDAE